MTAISGKSDAFENSMLLLIFNNTNIGTLGDTTGVRGSSTAGSLYFSLHTADPTEAGNQGSSEITYTSYNRTPKARASGAGGFTVTGSSVSPFDAVTFPAGTGGSGTAAFFGVGVSPTPFDSGLLLYGGAISPSIVCGSGITPQLTVATAMTES